MNRGISRLRHYLNEKSGGIVDSVPNMSKVLYDPSTYLPMTFLGDFKLRLDIVVYG